MRIDDTEAVEKEYGKVEPLDPDRMQRVLEVHSRIKAEFQEGDTLYHWNTTSFLAGSFGYLRVRDGEIVDVYTIGMS